MQANFISRIFATRSPSSQRKKRMGRRHALGQKNPMTFFRCVPMDPAAAARFRTSRRDDRGGAIQTRPVDGPGYPCRACLRLGQPGEVAPRILGFAPAAGAVLDTLARVFACA